MPAKMRSSVSGMSLDANATAGFATPIAALGLCWLISSLVH